MVDLKEREDSLSYEGLDLYEINGVRFHGEPGKENAPLSVYSNLTNEEELDLTKFRLLHLAKCVGKERVHFLTDIEAEALLKENAQEANLSRFDWAPGPGLQ